MANEENDLALPAFDVVPTFEELVDLQKWDTVEDYFAKCGDLITQDVEACATLRAALRRELDKPEIRERVQRPTESELEQAAEALFSGEVCAVDGTLAVIPSQSGGRARIGITATSYSGERIKRVLFVSYRNLAQPARTATEFFKKLKQVNRASALLMRAVMAFSERALALQQPQRWKIVHGELLPYELWAALGKGRPVSQRLVLARELIEAKTIVAVVEGSHNIELLNAGELLEPGEYLDARALTTDLNEYLGGHRDDGRGAHFNQEDRRDFEDFVRSHGEEIRVGIFKASRKAYIFQAHRDYFDEAARLVLRDAAHQPLRGFPLLLDYADRICAHHLASHEFDRQIQFKTARLGWETLASEIDPRKTRRA